ncbi:MAG: RluA family pseudouridine synthase [Christensenellales bacterium]
MITLYAKKHENVLKYLTEFEGLGFNKIQALFRKKDIKINGVRKDDKAILNIGDQIEIFCKNDYFFRIETVYEDNNIIILNKPKKLEVVSETKNISLLNLINPSYFAVHRLDFNTEGLVIFAKNTQAKAELDLAFSESKINKHYVTICKNYPQSQEQTFEDFLVKENKLVKVFKTKVANSKKIITKIKCLEKQNGFCLVDVNLVTGRTHQIRAHLAFHNLPVLGDEKYGDFKLNKKLNLKNQILRCYQISFNQMTNCLANLSGKTFNICFDDITSFFKAL